MLELYSEKWQKTAENSGSIQRDGEKLNRSYFLPRTQKDKVCGER